MKHVLILTTGEPTSERAELVREFARDLNSSEIQFEVAVIRELVFRITDGVPSVTLHDQELADSFQAVHLRNHNHYMDFACALRVYCDANRVTLVNRSDSVVPYFGKLSQGFLFATNNLPTPDLIASFSNQTLLGQLKLADWPFPYVIKHNDGIRGLHNYLIHSPAELADVLRQDKEGFVAQPFIDNVGELRVLTFGFGHDPLVFKKTAAAGEYLNNTHQGGHAELLATGDITPGVYQDALQASRLTGREIGGVDVLLSSDGKHYILEVNSTPAIASGVYLEDKQRKYRQYFIDSIAGNHE